MEGALVSSDSELREAMRSSGSIPTKGIDVDAVVRRSRARRVPKQIAFSSLSVLALVGVTTLAVSVLPSLQPGTEGASSSFVMTKAPESAQDSGAGDSSSSAKSTEPGQLTQNLCGTPTSSTAPNSAGLTLSVSFPDSAAAGGERIGGTVTLTNTGTSPVSGTTAIGPTVFVSHDGITVWHSHGTMISAVVEVSLSPGQSYSYDAFFTPVRCGAEDEIDGMFRDNLPAVTAGTYEVSAEILFVPSDTTAGGSIAVGGPATTIELR